MKKLFLIAIACLTLMMPAKAQILKRIGERAARAAEDAVSNKVNQKVREGIDSTFDKDKDSRRADDEEDRPRKNKKSKDPVVENPTASTSTDFKRGDVILFQDDVTGELVGEFPSKWDLLGGSAEVKMFDNKKCIEITDDGVITPLVKNDADAYLTEEFTLEFDYYYWDTHEDIGLNNIEVFLLDNDNHYDWNWDEVPFHMSFCVCDDWGVTWEVRNRPAARTDNKISQGWHTFQLSFNKRALKVYFDGKRVINLPTVDQAKWFAIKVPFRYENLTFIRNVVLAKGAVALYDRNAQTMEAQKIEKAFEATGKFVTNNILFETGKATLKPESMVDIQAVADYMKKNPSVRFEVQGHCDNQGSDKVNDPLSQQRAEAIVTELVKLGVDEWNLRAVGKGSHEPVADNKTEEGRAKNRRVEFIKK